jgi:methyltransferase
VLIRLAVCLAMAAARLGEVAWSRQNVRMAGPSAEGSASRRTYVLIVATHTATIAGTAIFGRRARWPWLALLVAVQPLRAWALATLGRRWNVRGSVAADVAVETGGPYRYVRHPNYAVVVVELAALPLAFGLPRLAILLFAANGALLAVRIRDEERLLAAHAAWRDHFARRKRFVPGLF